MTEPLHHVSDAFHPQPFGQFWSRDHDDGQTEHAGGVDLGARAVAAGVTRHNPIDAAHAHHLQFAIMGERSARYDHIGSKGQRRFGRIDEAQRVGVLRPRRERCDVLATDGEERACGGSGQRGNRSGDITDFNPLVARHSGPGRAFERNQRRTGLRACFNGVAAHLGREGMRRIDHMRDAFAADVIGKSVYAAKAADAGRQRLIGRRAGAATIGIYGIDARARDLRGELVRIGNSAQDKGASHG